MAGTKPPAHLDHLRTAITALQTAHAAKKAADPADGDSDSYYDNIPSLIRQSKSLLSKEWVNHHAMADTKLQEASNTTLVEVGAKLSKETQGHIKSVMDNLHNLLQSAAKSIAADGDEITATAEVTEAFAMIATLADSFVGDLKEGVTAPTDLPTVSDAVSGWSEAVAEIKKKKKAATPAKPDTKDLDETHREQLARLGAGLEYLPESAGRPISVSTALVMAEAEDSSPGNPTYRTFVLKEGTSKNRVNYSGKVIKESAPLLDGRPIYVDHPAGLREGRSDRSLGTKAGWWTNPTYEENVKLPNGDVVSGLFAKLHLFGKESSPVPWLPGMIAESIAAGHPELVGISILAAGETKLSKDKDGPYKEALSIKHYASADAVAEPGAAGQPISFAANNGKDVDVMGLETLTIAELRETRPELIAALLAEAGTTPNPATTTNPTTPVVDPAAATILSEATTALAEMRSEIDRGKTRVNLATALAGSRLPQKIKTMISDKVGVNIMAEADIKSLVEEYETAAAALLTESDSPTALPPGAFVPFRGVAEGQTDPLDQVMASLDNYFGAEVDPKMAGKFPKIRSFSEFYRRVTGDTEVDGHINESLSVLGDRWGKPMSIFSEALPGSTHVIGGGTITMPNLLGTAMNKALFQLYQGQERWWEPVVKKEDISNLKKQTRIRLQNFGSLTERTVDGAEYTELDWGEVEEDWTPTEYGNVVTVGRRAIINDDLKGIQNIPKLLADSAIFTINEYVANLFTANSGLGPTLTDTYNVFNAAQHQGNKGTSAFSRAAVVAARTAMYKYTNDASKRLGILPRTILAPIDLQEDAWQLIKSEKVPESPNNAPNLLSDNQYGLARAIAVPQFTDTNNWYLMAEVSQIVGIELGFLFGREEPELFVQDQPTVGMTFTNDVIAHKVRWDFGGDWIDWRAGYASIVP